MVVIVPNFDQRVNVALCSGAGPLSERESCSIVGRFDGSEARRTQDASVYKMERICKLQLMASGLAIELTLVQDVREVVLGHF